jgi:hypothetical protein
MADRPDDEVIPPVSAERKAEARGSLRERFPQMTDDDFDAVSQEESKTSKLEIFLQKLMEKTRWSRDVCQQQIGMGTDDVRDC